jgi:hypothetical protein
MEWRKGVVQTYRARIVAATGMLVNGLKSLRRRMFGDDSA